MTVAPGQGIVLPEIFPGAPTLRVVTPNHFKTLIPQFLTERTPTVPLKYPVVNCTVTDVSFDGSPVAAKAG